MNLLSEAICFATSVFEGQKRKCENCPAIFHSIEAGYIANTLTDDEDIIVATVLHDTVEDAGVSLEELETRFGKRVAELVRGESENKRESEDPCATWQVRKQEAIDIIKNTDDIGLKILFLSDKLSNMRSLSRCKSKLGDELWGMFHQTDPQAHFWYYNAIAEAVSELSDTFAYQEYLSLIEKTFSEE